MSVLVPVIIFSVLLQNFGEFFYENIRNLSPYTTIIKSSSSLIIGIVTQE